MSCFVSRMERKQQRRAARESTPAAGPAAYACSRCRQALFDEETKFDSRTGFPSFWGHKGTAVVRKRLTTYGRERIQLLCSQCEQHLGHLFPNKHTPSGLRYCINAAALDQVVQGQDE